MDQSIHVLHVEDDPDFADLVSTFLQREDDRINIQTATTPADGLEILSEDGLDCIVSDYDMPGRNGIEFLEAVRDDYPDLPFILYTGKGSEEVASDAISAGVTDYLQKGGGTSQYTVLANRIWNVVEQYRAQTDLAERELRLNLFFEQSPLGVIRWDDEFNFARLNDTAGDILGYPEDELVGQPWEVVIPEEDREEIGEVVVSDLLANEGGYHSINENIRKDGERIVCEWHNWVVTDETGDVVAVFSQFEDITERREQQKELERYRAITQASTNTILTINEANTIQSVNSAVEETFGYEPAEIVDEKLTELMADDVADRHQAAFDRYVETGEKTVNWNYFEVPGRHRDGSTIPLSLSIGQATFDGDQFFVGIIRDVSERKERERELETERNRFRAVFEEAFDAMLIADDDGQYIDANQSAAELFGVPQEDVLGRSIAEFAPDGFDFETAWREFQQSEKERDTFPLVRPDGTERVVEYAATTNVVPGEHLSILRDVTERKQRTRKLERQNKRLEEFASVVSHDLRNPLNVAEGHLDLARGEYDSEHLDAIARAHDRMWALINDLLALSRGDEMPADVSSVELAGLVENCWRSVDTKDATLVAKSERTISADESRLRHLFENLIRNAVEHGGEAVTMTVGEMDNGFFIEDDGSGIPAAHRDTVFDAGYTTAQDGTGFGLSIVKEVVDAHDWDIRVTEGSEGGARFEITGVETGDE